jgi:diacylglycerol kinase family enzyme
MKVTLIHNPDAGDNDNHSGDQILRLIREAGHKPRYHSAKEKTWKRALKKPGDIVAVAGGDGTVGKVAKRLIDIRTPIAILPMGTANNIANTLGLTGKKFQDLIDGWKSARCINFDAGVAKGPWGAEYFIEGFGIGLFAETMFKIENGEHPHPPTSEDAEEEIETVLKLLKNQLAKFSSRDLTVRLDGKDLSGNYFLLEALNVRYVGPKLDLVPSAEINDGLFDVVFVSKKERAKLGLYIADRLKHKRSRVSLTIRRGRHLQVERESSPVHIDDMPWPEDRESSPVLSNAIDVKIEPGALVFLQPDNNA